MTYIPVSPFHVLVHSGAPGKKYAPVLYGDISEDKNPGFQPKFTAMMAVANNYILGSPNSTNHAAYSQWFNHFLELYWSTVSGQGFDADKWWNLVMRNDEELVSYRYNFLKHYILPVHVDLHGRI